MGQDEDRFDRARAGRIGDDALRRRERALARRDVKRAADWPRYMKIRRLAEGQSAFYWVPHERDRASGFKLAGEPLGSNFEAAAARARLLNEHLDSWRLHREIPRNVLLSHRVGTVDWWHLEYFKHEAFTKLKPRTQSDYREVLRMVSDVPTAIQDARTSQPKRVGELLACTLSQQAVDKIYSKIRDGGRVNRQADLAMDVCRRAWKVVRRANPGLFSFR